MPTSHPLRVFICYASQDKSVARELYQRLRTEDWLDPWLNEEKLLPGMDWDLEIYKALRDADAIIVCLSKESVIKEGYVQKEYKRALNFAEEKPDGTIFIIPLRLDDCSPPTRLQQWQWLDYFEENAHEVLLKSLRARANMLGQQVSEDQDDLDLSRFIKITPAKISKVSYSFWIGKYPVTNSQYQRFLQASDFADPVYWVDFPTFDENCHHIGNWRETGWQWALKEFKTVKSRIILPRFWYDQNFGKLNPNNPVVGISWYEASAYCEWLFQNWSGLSECKANPGLQPRAIRLPLETEWITAAGGDMPEGRYPWDEIGKSSTSLKEILRRANVSIEDTAIDNITLKGILRNMSISTNEGGIGHTTPVDKYPLGKSLYGVMDMSGNVFEWQANFHNEEHTYPALRGGSWDFSQRKARVAYRDLSLPPYLGFDSVGFRVAISADLY